MKQRDEISLIQNKIVKIDNIKLTQKKIKDKFNKVIHLFKQLILLEYNIIKCSF
jgi:hypothetical protein